MKNIETVVFDLGGVLIDWNPLHLYNKIFENPKKARSFIDEICTLDWNEQQDGGRTIKEGTDWLITKHPEYSEEIKAYYDRWEEMLSGPIWGSVEILNQLYHNKIHRLYALTNWSAETWPTALKLFDFLHHFEGVLVSGQEGLKKPDHKIYHLLFEKFDIIPDKAVFIDDNLRNIKAAEEVGLNTIHFKDPIDLKEKLSVLQII